MPRARALLGDAGLAWRASSVGAAATRRVQRQCATLFLGEHLLDRHAADEVVPQLPQPVVVVLVEVKGVDSVVGVREHLVRELRLEERRHAVALAPTEAPAAQ